MAKQRKKKKKSRRAFLVSAVCLVTHSPLVRKTTWSTCVTYGWQLAHGSELVVGGVDDQEDTVVLFVKIPKGVRIGGVGMKHAPHYNMGMGYLKEAYSQTIYCKAFQSRKNRASI